MNEFRKLINIVEQNILQAPMEPTYKRDPKTGQMVPDIDYKLNPGMKSQPEPSNLPRLDAPMEPTYKRDPKTGQMVPDVDYKLNPQMKSPKPTTPPARPTTPKMPTVPRQGTGIKKVTENEFAADVETIIAEINRVSPKQDLAEGQDSEELANEIYAEFERIYPNLARRANERSVHAAIIDVLNYGNDRNPAALAQDVARAVKRDLQQGMTESNDKPETFGDQFADFLQDFARKRGLTARSGPPPRRVPQRNPDIDRIPELEAKLQELTAEYESLGGNNWQYADREQNLTPNERKARNIEYDIRNLQNRIYYAKKEAEQEGRQGVAEGVGKSDYDLSVELLPSKSIPKIKDELARAGIDLDDVRRHPWEQEAYVFSIYADGNQLQAAKDIIWNYNNGYHIGVSKGRPKDDDDDIMEQGVAEGTKK